MAGRRGRTDPRYGAGRCSGCWNLRGGAAQGAIRAGRGRRRYPHAAPIAAGALAVPPCRTAACSRPPEINKGEGNLPRGINDEAVFKSTHPKAADASPPRRSAAAKGVTSAQQVKRSTAEILARRSGDHR